LYLIINLYLVYRLPVEPVEPVGPVEIGKISDFIFFGQTG
jgi:hypothetical protein